MHSLGYKFFLQIYAFAGYVLSPFFGFHLEYRARRGKEDASRLDERHGFSHIPRPLGKLIWFHAASIGESLAAQPVIKRLNEQYSDFSILITTGTVTSSKVIESQLRDTVIHQFLPLDTTSAITRFLDHWRPDLAIWMESELWPITMAGIRERGIPALLINARMSTSSYRKWSIVPTLAKGVLSTFDACLAQSEIDRIHFSKLGAQEVMNLGNLKHGAGPLPAKGAEVNRLQEWIGERPAWVFASTHEGEEVIAGQIHTKLTAEIPNLLTFIVPRHPNRGREIENILLSYGFNISLRSRGDILLPDTSIYIVDTIGELGVFYRVCKVVCMGKSFITPGGGQNPLEPAQLGCAVILGPYMSNFEEVSFDMVKHKAAIRVESADDLLKALKECFAKGKKINEIQKKASTYCQGVGNIIDRTVDRIIAMLPNVN